MKVKIPVPGTVGRSVNFDPDAGPRAEAAVKALAAQISAGLGGSIRHSALQGLQIGDDHPQYTGNAFPETITGQWNFSTIPFIQGETLAEYIEDVVGGSFFDFLQDTTSVVWTYFDTAQQLEANVPPEFVQDTVGAMLVDSTSIDFTYNDPAGTFTASTINANPTASVGLTAVNGTAATPMRSDGAPALDVGISPTWSGTHTFNNTPVVPNNSWTYAKIQDVTATSRVLGRISSGSGDIEELTGANIATILGSAIPVGANPSASVGLSTVNGSAASFMRSDGAPALDQGIAPVWTANHDWLDNAKAIFGTGLDLQVYHDGTNSILSNATGQLQFYVPSGQQFYFEGPSGQMRLNSSTATNAASLLFYLGGANKARWGVEGTAGATITGSQVGDGFIVVLGSTRVLFGDVSTDKFYGAFANSTTAADTRLMVYDVDTATLARVSVGAADSGGVGFKVLRIPN